MKKIYLAIAAFACCMNIMNAQSIKVYKGTDVVASFSSAQADSVVFSGAEEQKTRPTAAITDPAKVQMLNSLQALDGNRLYLMNYTCDYKLDDLLELGTDNISDLLTKGAQLLFDAQSAKPAISQGFGCSAYAATNTAGNCFMGRNFDFAHIVTDKSGNKVEEPTTAIILITSPTNGFKSVNVLDPYFLNFKNGFYDDGSDLSALIFAPYDVFDGMNEKGLAVCDLFLDGDYAEQNEAGKKNIFATVALRAILDKCSTVDEAITFLQKYNMRMGGAVGKHGEGSLHFYMADATGDFAIIEYSFEDKDLESITAATVPTRFTVLKGDDAYRYMTNFYVDPRLSNCQYGGLSQHGRDRYNVLKSTIQAYNNKLSDVRAKSLLESVSQTSDPADPTSHTQWSSLYDLTNKTLEISILQEYGNWYKFSLK